MPLTRYRVNWPLWLFLSVVLFVVPWFVPMTQSWVPWKYWAVLLLERNLESSRFAIQGIVVCSLLFGIPALAVGWVLQCILVIIWHAMTSRGRR